MVPNRRTLDRQLDRICYGICPNFIEMPTIISNSTSSESNQLNSIVLTVQFDDIKVRIGGDAREVL